jgi:4-hydroxybutyryl-CoA dehydratase/vinylacetyl-CoA-Delta-isomerase
MRNSQEFLASLEDGREVYYRGKKVESISEHPVLRIAATHAAKLFYMERAVSEEKFGEYSAYFSIPRSPSDLQIRHKLIYDTTMRCNGVFNISQAIGSDALFALTITTDEADSRSKTNYRKVVEDYWSAVRKNDLTLAVAQTDVKGDRKKRPNEQSDPDMYVHVTKVEKDGIIVNGAKAHTTQAAVSDEIIAIPTRAMGDEDKDYAVAFAVPAATKGLKLIVRPIDELEGNSSAVISKEDYELETLTIFENVFVPWSRVFLCREHELAGRLAILFATFHRFTAVSYRSATANLYLGASISVAKQNGILGSPHVRDRLGEIVMYKELMRMSAIAAANLPVISGEIAVPNPLYTNIGKLYSNENFSRVLDALVDISGGIISTLPSFEDQISDIEAKLITKYLAGSEGGEKRIEILRIAKELGASSHTGYMLTLMLHAEGSVEASKLALLRDADLKEPEQVIENILSKNRQNELEHSKK